MKQLAIILLTISALAAVPVAGAEPVEDEIISQLREQGYDTIRVSRTILGRRRIEATSELYWREIIVNPRTGEILRDYWRALSAVAADGSANGPLINPVSGEEDDDDSSDSDGSNDDDDDSDDDSDDDDDSSDDDDSGDDEDSSDDDSSDDDEGDDGS